MRGWAVVSCSFVLLMYNLSCSQPKPSGGPGSLPGPSLAGLELQFPPPAPEICGKLCTASQLSLPEGASAFRGRAAPSEGLTSLFPLILFFIGNFPNI